MHVRRADVQARAACQVHPHLLLQVVGSAAAAQHQLFGSPVASRVENQLVTAASIEQADVQRPPRTELLIVREVPSRAARGPKVADDVRDERGLTGQGDAVCREARIGRRLERRKWYGNGRRALVEKGVAA